MILTRLVNTPPHIQIRTSVCAYFLVLLLFSHCQAPTTETTTVVATTSLDSSVTIVPLQPQHLIDSVQPFDTAGTLQAVIEIPAGTLWKNEVNKTTGQLEVDQENGAPRMIRYLGYPGNYGLVPQTLLDLARGGDGDPLDILVLGHPVEQGTVTSCRLVGVLKLLDNGEQDDLSLIHI